MPQEILFSSLEEAEKKIKDLSITPQECRIKVVAQSLLDHERGNMTLDDLQMCYNAIMKVKKMVSG
ncbi:MAG: hypothetical protein QW726_06575, partial [Fervidicoccaceae archaeon]